MYQNLKNEINQYIKTNGTRSITGALLNGVLNDMVDALGAVGGYGGIITPTSAAPQSDGNVFFVSNTAGTYTNFSNIVVNENELAFIYRSGNGWVKDGITLSAGGTEVEANPTGTPTETMQTIKIGETIYTAPEGPEGPTGPANALTIGTVTDGEQAAAEIVGTPPNQTLNLTLPRGQQGVPGQDGANAVNPFKGWYTTDNIPTTGQAGDYCYVTDDGTTKVWKWNPDAEPPAFEETADTPDTDYTQTFASAESVNQVAIDDSHLVNPVNTADHTKPVLAKAEDVMQLKAKLEGVTKEETKATYSILTGANNKNGYIKKDGNTITFQETTNQTDYIACKINVAGYTRLRFVGFVKDSSTIYAFGFLDSNENLIDSTVKNYDVDTSQQQDYTLKEYIIDIPTNAAFFGCEIKLPNVITENDFYCYLQSGKSVIDLIPNVVDNFQHEENIADTFTSVFNRTSHAISSITGKWFTDPTYQNYLIPISADKDKFLIIKSNATNGAIFAFLKEGYIEDGQVPNYADGFNSTLLMDANSEIEMVIPHNAKYLYIYNGIDDGVDRQPQKLIISEYSRDSFNGVSLEYTTKTLNKYINNSLVEANVNGFDLYEFDVSNVDVIGIHGKVGNNGYNVFYNENNEVITYFKSEFMYQGTYECDFNNTYNVPEGAKTLKMSLKQNLGFSVKNCVSVSKNEPNNILSGKKVSFIGDSITYGYGLTNLQDRWTTIFSREFARCVENNLGYSGTCIASNAKVDANKNANRFITRATQLTIGDSDVIFVFGSINDFTADSKAIGNIYNEVDITSSEFRGNKKKVSNGDTDTFAGALHELLNQIQNINQTAKVIYINILNKGLSSSLYPTGIDMNANGDYLQDFNNTINIICDFYGIPVIPLNKLFGQNWNYDDNTQNPPILHNMNADGVHPNVLGHRRIAEVVFNYVINNRLV